jgi:radical SAM protein with 4Fe4S-binding SPASM domain
MRSLEITVRIGCSNMCSYCPQEKLIAAYKDPKKIMGYDDFISLLRNVPKDVEIHFSGFAEPFLNREASLMMKYAYLNGWELVMYTTLSGFREEDAEILKGIHFKILSLHQYDGRNYNEEDFQRKRHLLLSSIGGPKDTKGGRVKNIISRAGNTYDVPGTKGSLYCSAAPGLDHNVVLPNGDVYLCCMDYSLKHYLGNLNKTHYNDLDRESVRSLLRENDSDVICRKCDRRSRI